jgi:hypothetical protein
VARRGGQQGAIRHGELRPRDLPAQNLEFVPQHQQFDVFHVQAAAATNKRPEQRPHDEIEEGESHVADPPSLAANQARQQYWRPSAMLSRRCLSALPHAARDVAGVRVPSLGLSEHYEESEPESRSPRS